MGHQLDTIAKTVGGGVTSAISPITDEARHIAGTSLVQPLRLLPQSVQNYAYPIIGSMVGGPFGAAAGSALNTYNQGGNLKQVAANAVGSGVGSYVGGNLGDSFLSGGANSVANMGTIGGAVNNTLGSTASNALASSAPQIAGSNLGRAVGSFAGGSLGSSLADSLTAPSPKAPDPWKPTQDTQANLPTSLTGSLTGLSPLQQSTNLASRGVYGGGNGPQEEQYFLNQENRRLVDQSGNVSDISSLSPVEMSYLQKLGLGGYGNSSDLLKAMSSWQAA